MNRNGWIFWGMCLGLLWAQPNFNLVGFATQNGGTTGGAGGEEVTVRSYSELKTAAESSGKKVIYVEGEISNGSAGGQIRVKSDKSIVGVGSSAFLNGVGIAVSSVNNVIIQNLKLTLVGTSNPAGINGGDLISIDGTSKNVWVDHCELYSEDPDKQTNKDKYDGLIDIKQQTGFITLSWNYLHDHWKGGLVGASDTDLNNDRKVTMHHNYYNKVKLRVPMYRGSTGHFFNNYIVGAKDATEIRAGTCVRVEKNYYESLNYSIYTPSDSKGSTERIDNIEVKRASRAYPGNCTANIPYDYSAWLTNTTSDVKSIVPQYAGVGKLNQTPVDQAPEILTGDSLGVPENQQSVGVIQGVDPEGKSLTWSIGTGSDSEHFRIDANSGELSFAVPPDFENPVDGGFNNIYWVYIRLSDGVHVTELKTAIHVTDVDENSAPVFVTGDSLNAMENETSIAVIQANDAEGDPLTWSIGTGSDSEYFQIDSNTGELSFIAAPDFENPIDGGFNNVYWVYLQVSDGKWTTEQKTAIHLQDVFEEDITKEWRLYIQNTNFKNARMIDSKGALLMKFDGNNSINKNQMIQSIQNLKSGQYFLWLQNQNGQKKIHSLRIP